MKRQPPKWGLFRFFMRDLYGFVTSYIKTHYCPDGIPQQTCRVCGASDGYDFHVPDKVWVKIVPLRYQNSALCLNCFDRFATNQAFDYRLYLSDVCFAGEIGGIEFDNILSEKNIKDFLESLHQGIYGAQVHERVVSDEPTREFWSGVIYGYENAQASFVDLLNSKKGVKCD